MSKRAEKAKLQQDSIRNRDFSYKLNKSEQIKKLKSQSDEVGQILKDVRYVHLQEFLTEYKNNCLEALQNICGNPNSKELMQLQGLKFASQLEFIDILLDRPYRIFEQLRETEKEIE